ncbi:VanZ family protein [Kitasatospora sp. NPDC004531]
MLLTLHLLALGWLALRPVSAPWTGPSNLTPFATVHQDLAAGGLTAARRLAAGLVPLAPVGVLLPLAVGSPRRAWFLSFLRTTAAAALLATALEFLEGWAPGNVLNVDDILLGTLGAAALHLLVTPLLRAHALRRAPGVRAAAAPRQESPKERTPVRPAPARRPVGGRVQPFR